MATPDGSVCPLTGTIEAEPTCIELPPVVVRVSPPAAGAASGAGALTGAGSGVGEGAGAGVGAGDGPGAGVGADALVVVPVVVDVVDVAGLELEPVEVGTELDVEGLDVE